MKKVPINFAKQARVLPVGWDGDAVRVAVADPSTRPRRTRSRCCSAPGSCRRIVPGAVVVDAINRVYDQAADEHERLMEDLETEDLESVAHELEEPTTSSTPTTRRRSSGW